MKLGDNEQKRRLEELEEIRRRTNFAKDAVGIPIKSPPPKPKNQTEKEETQ